jgi:ABC-2 type transport system permease protein
MKWGISVMPSRTSLFNKEMILQVGRSIGWISVIYFLGLLFAVPIKIMMTYSGDEYRYFGPINSIFKVEFGFQFILFVTVPVLLAVFLYRFLHVKQAADLMHSLPLKREKIYHFYTLTGFVFLLIPVLLISLITIMIHSLYNLNLYFQLQDIAVWTGTVILFNAVLYIAGVFVAMVTGISAVQGVLTYILLLFPAGFSLLVIYNLGMMLYGFPSDYYQSRNIENMTPITHLAQMESQKLSVKEIVLYLVILLTFYVLSMFIYKKRKIESASEAIAFASLKVVFKYGVTLCTMLLGGMYFNAMQNQFGWLLFGYGFGAVIGYFVAEMVLQKSWRVFRNVRGLGLFAAAIIVFILLIQILSPYEKRVPGLNEVKSVTLTNSNHNIEDEFFRPKPLKERKNIELVRQLHSEIITNEKLNANDKDMGEYAIITYELSNGKKMIRQYHIDRMVYQQNLKKIHESLEYKHATNPIFSVKPEKVKSLRISDGSMLDKRLILTERDEITEALKILKLEIEKEPYEPDYYQRGNQSTIEIELGTNYPVYAELRPSYKTLINWLDRKGLLDEAMVTTEDVDYIIVTDEVIKEEDFKEYPEPEILEKILNNKKSLKVTEKGQIQAALETAGYGWFNEQPFTAVFVYKNGSHKEIRTFSEKHVPDFIKEHFK